MKNLQSFIEKNLYKKSIISYILLPFSTIYLCIQLLHRLYYKINSPQKIGNFKTICIGNIVSGGSGKTPFTIFLTKHLLNMGLKVAISHRGYKGKFENENKLISNRNEIFSFAKESGDEAYLLAEKLKSVPVIVGKNRKKSLAILDEKFPNLDFVILDDSYQHLKIIHDFDFVVFNTIGGIGNGFVLPSGILREPLFSLNKKDIFVINGDGNISELEKYSNIKITGKYIIARIYNEKGKEILIEDLKKSKICLLSGIGFPKSFELMIENNICQFNRHFRLPDHFDFKDQKLFKEIEKYLNRNKIDFLLTTEKDFTKLKHIQNKNLPLIVIGIEFKMENQENIIKILNHI